jgi:glycosyltransferase involved in cell wall biosynthesis
MMKLYNVDRVIGLKFPAYLIPHPHKSLWLVHQFRQAYDLAGSNMSHVPTDREGEELRRCVAAADDECFTNSDNLLAISRVVQRRLKRFNNHESEVLHPPLDDAELFRPIASGDYIFCGGRINQAKRQHLLVEALAHVRTDVRLLIAGPPDSPADGERLQSLIKRHHLGSRVELHLGFQPRERLVHWVNHSLASACIPYDEDYGYVTLEAFYAGKPVLTTNDAGGVLDFVDHRHTGLIVEPSPESLAAAITELSADRQTAVAWGEAARDHIHDRNINWPETIKKLAA